MSDDEGREVAVTYTWVVTVLPGESVVEAVWGYVNSVAWAFDEPVSVKGITPDIHDTADDPHPLNRDRENPSVCLTCGHSV